MKLTQKEKILLGILLFVLGGYLYFKFIYLTESKAIRNLKSEYAIKMKVLSQVNNKDIRMKEIDAQLNKLRTELKPIQSKISQPVRVPQLLQEVDQAAAATSVLIDIVTFSGDYASVKGKALSSNASSLLEQIKVLGDGGSIPSKPTPTPQTQNKPKLTPALKTLSIQLNFNCTYDNLQNFLLYFENNPRFYVVDVLDINNSGNMLTGNLVIKTFSTVPLDEPFTYNSTPDLSRISPFIRN